MAERRMRLTSSNSILRVILTIAALASFSTIAPAQPIDVQPVLRSEPAYKTGPRYIKIVFGNPTTSVSWLVMDGDVAYIDRHCTGHLTDKACCVIAEPKDIPPAEPTAEALQKWQNVLIDMRADPKRVRALYQQARALNLQHRYFKLGFVDAEDGRHELEMHSLPDGITINKLDGLWQSTGRIVASSKSATAPIVHFNGPLELSVFAPDWVHHKPGGKLNRRSANFFAVIIDTPGQGEGTFACLYCKDVPKEVSPTAEISLARCGKDGKSTVSKTVKLSQRC
jgi:hypothetical protein